MHWSGFNVDNLMLFSAAVAAHKSCSPALCQSHFLGSGEGEPALGCQVGGASGVLTEALHVAPQAPPAFLSCGPQLVDESVVDGLHELNYVPLACDDCKIWCVVTR